MLNYSVLMTVYKNDSPEFFIQSVRSMLDQTVKTNDFVLVCDGKLTDELESAINTVFKKNKEILTLVRLSENVGLGKALRRGLSVCKNDWVARMDDDDIANRNRCEIELKYIEEHPEISILGSYMNEFEENLDHPIRVKKVPTDYNEILKYSKRRNPFNHSTLFIRKKDILAAGNYSTMRTNQDVDTWVRVLNKGYRGANIPQTLVNFRFDHNTYKRRKEWKNIRLMIVVWRKFWKRGYCSFGDYVYVFITQFMIFIMPNKVLQWAYNHLR